MAQRMQAAVAAPPDLTFAVARAEGIAYAAVPTLAFRLRITSPGRREIRSIVLRAQVRIHAARRDYAGDEEARLLELFGPRRRWGETMKSLLWGHASTVVPAFTAETEADLPLVCTYDFDVTSAKYLHALSAGEIPVELLFSGTLFYMDGERLQAAQVPWDKEAECRVAVPVWRDMMDAYFPNSAWLRIRRDAFDRLYRYKARHALPTWEAALERLIPDGEDQHG